MTAARPWPARGMSDALALVRLSLLGFCLNVLACRESLRIGEHVLEHTTLQVASN